MTAKDDLFAQNRAVYLPALSKPFALFAHSGSFKRPLPFTATDLNFLDPHNGLFHYPYALYSAGQAAKAKVLRGTPDIVSARSRDRTIVLGDSGGFQVQSGTIKFEGRETTRRMMRWMEAQTDYSMVLDFPTGGIASGMMHKHTERLQRSRYPLAARIAANGLSADYNACAVPRSERLAVLEVPVVDAFLPEMPVEQIRPGDYGEDDEKLRLEVGAWIVEALHGLQHCFPSLQEQLISDVVEARCRIDMGPRSDEVAQLISARCGYGSVLCAIPDLFDPAMIDGSRWPRKVRKDFLIPHSLRYHRLHHGDFPAL